VSELCDGGKEGVERHGLGRKVDLYGVLGRKQDLGVFSKVNERSPIPGSRNTMNQGPIENQPREKPTWYVKQDT